MRMISHRGRCHIWRHAEHPGSPVALFFLFIDWAFGFGESREVVLHSFGYIAGIQNASAAAPGSAEKANGADEHEGENQE